MSSGSLEGRRKAMLTSECWLRCASVASCYCSSKAQFVCLISVVASQMFLEILASALGPV